jgi:putative transposase
VERNPVAANLVRKPEDWPWSSCRAHLGLADIPAWLDSDGLHSYVLGETVIGAAQRRRAQRLYAQLVGQAQDGDDLFWRDALQGQVFLGDDNFVQRMRAQAEPQRVAHKNIPKAQRLRPRTWAQWLKHCRGERDTALYAAYREGGMTMTALAEQARLSVSHVSRLIAQQEHGR